MKRVFTYGRLLSISALTLCLAAVVGCPPGGTPEPFQIVYPVSSQDFSINPDGQLVMVVEFTHAVDMSSLAPGINVILDTNAVTNAEISVAAGDTNKEIVITSAASASDLLRFTPDGWFTLTLKGESWYAPPVRSTAGVRLDGNSDGVGGGVFEHDYILIG